MALSFKTSSYLKMKQYKEEPSCPGLINLIGIESPGFTAAVPISFMVRDILKQHINLVEKSDFRATRKAHVRFRDLPREEQEKLIPSPYHSSGSSQCTVFNI